MLSKNQVNEIRGLHQRKQRELSRRFIAEGTKTVIEIISHRPSVILKIFATSEFINSNASLLKKNQVSCQEINDDELKKISLQQTPNQALAIGSYFEVDANAQAAGFALYLDDIRDPGNFGTILRLCDWFGYNTIYCSPTSCERYNPKVIQASMGAFLRVQVIYCTVSEIAAQFRHIYGAVLGGRDLYSEKLQEGLLVIGNEANGIRPETLAFVRERISIPAGKAGGSESLNAAMAASIATAEFFRQLRG